MPARGAPDESWVSPHPRGGGVRVAVAYPNSYRVGMSNLGFQAVLGAFLEQPGFHARRVFWEGGSLRFPDGGRSLVEFDAVAISISYQPDMVHLPRMMEAVMAAGDPEAAPLVIGGGVALTINPETSSPLFDIVVLGDAEPVLPALMDALGSGRPSKRDIISRLRGREGVYIPGDFGGRAGSGSPAAPSPAPSGDVPAIRPAVLEDLDRSPARPAVLSRHSEFGNIYPLEVSRGCGAGCRFCAAGAVCGPVRFLGLETFAREVDRGLGFRKRIGLVGTAVSFHPRLTDMARYVLEAGGSFSPSSIRAERVTGELARLLSRAGHRTVSLAPEAGTERLRAALGKGFSDVQFLERVGLLLEAGIPNLKLYFMAGLPGEGDEDAEGIVDLVSRVRDRMLSAGRVRGRVGTLTVSLNPFVPKPRTAFERVPMAPESVLERRMKTVRRRAAPLGGVRVQTGSVRGAYLDALLSLGGRTVADILDKLPPGGVSLNRLVKIFPGAEQVLFGRETGPLPWAFIK